MRVRLTIAAAAATLLASVGLYPLFETLGWFGTGLGAILVVALTGALTRRFRLPAVVCLAVAAITLLVYLTALFTPHRALLAVVPTPGSVAALARLLGDGRREANGYAAPVPALPGIELLSGAGIGTIAVLVDFLAVRVRRAAPAGLPLLALYSVPATVREEGTGWLIFLLGAGGYLALLVADGRERLTGWGRPVFTRRWSADRTPGERPDATTPYDATPPDATPLAVTGRRVGLTAMAAAIVVPLAVPGLQPHGLLGIGGNGDGERLTTVTTPDPLVSLKRQLVRPDDAVVLTYRSSDDIAPDYLRMYSLDRFDGAGWTYSAMHGDRNSRVGGRTLPAPPGLSGTATRPVTTKIKVDSRVRGMNVLPAPYPPSKVSIKGDWRADTPTLMIFSLHDSAGGRTYTVSSVRPAPTYRQLETAPQPPSGVAARYLALPGRLPRDVVDLAHKITAAASTPYDRAIKLQQWFTRPGDFTYSLDTPPPRGVDALQDFLFHGKTGYCEQFAASMALLARIAGIPARVGMGYTAGTRQADGTWVVRTKDTHAWPELYFAGVGWLRFEPTPAGGGGQGSATVPGYATPQLLPGTPDGGATPRLPSTGGLPTDGPTSTAATRRHRGDGLGNTGSAGPVPHPRGGPPVGRLLLVLAAVLLVTPAAIRRGALLRRWAAASPDASGVLRVLPSSIRRRAAPRRWAGTSPDAAVAYAAWDELRAAALDHGLPWRAGDSPRAVARRLGEARRFGAQTRAALDRLVRAEELARYAPVPGSAAGLREDVRAVRAAFAAGSSRPVRWRARLFPPSATVTLRHAGGRLLDAFDRLDSLRLRRRAHG